jgi:hypothetical protein
MAHFAAVLCGKMVRWQMRTVTWPHERVVNVKERDRLPVDLRERVRRQQRQVRRRHCKTCVLPLRTEVVDAAHSTARRSQKVLLQRKCDFICQRLVSLAVSMHVLCLDRIESPLQKSDPRRPKLPRGGLLTDAD